jgi:adenylate cyclase class 2
MNTEIEIKFLDIDRNVIQKKLTSIGAVRIHPEQQMRRKVYDYPDERLRKIGGWIRVRDEGDKITLSYKQLNDRSLHGTKEITVSVNDFADTCKLLETIGLTPKSYQETKREKWLHGKSEITIDTWPWIPPFIEIESSSEDELRTLVTKLGFNWTKGLHGSVETAYQKYFDVTEEEIDDWESIVFVPVPDWLERKRLK